MANRAKQRDNNGARVQFPPEADGDFDMVSESKIADWQKKLNARFGIGQGNLKVVEDVKPAG